LGSPSGGPREVNCPRCGRYSLQRHAQIALVAHGAVDRLEACKLGFGLGKLAAQIGDLALQVEFQLSEIRTPSAAARLGFLSQGLSLCAKHLFVATRLTPLPGAPIASHANTRDCWLRKRPHASSI